MLKPVASFVIVLASAGTALPCTDIIVTKGASTDGSVMVTYSVDVLFTKYNDSYVKDPSGRPQEVGYPEAWLREVARSRHDRLELESKGAIASPSAY